MTEEIAFYYNKFRSQQPEPDLVAGTGDSLVFLLDDTGGAETVQYRESDFDFSPAPGSLAAGLVFDMPGPDRGDDVSMMGGHDDVSSLTVAINGVRDMVAEDYDYPAARHDGFEDAANVVEFTATDDLWI